MENEVTHLIDSKMPKKRHLRERLQYIDDSKESIFLILSFLWMLAISLSWWLAQKMSGTMGYFGSTEMPYGIFSELTSWLPMAAEVSRGNLFPSEPSLGTGATGFSFYPYISIWFHGLLITLLGIQGADFFGTTFFPTAAFILLVFIYNQYLPSRWSVSLAAVGLIGFVSLPFREFLGNLLTGTGWRELGTIQNLEVAHFPMPAFSLVCFLAVFYLSIHNKRLTLGNMIPISILWGLQILVHPINAILGLLFWFTTIPLKLSRQNQKKSLGWLLAQVALQGILVLAVTAPTLWAYYNLGQSSIDFQTLGVSHGEGEIFSSFYYIAYFAFPLSLLAFVYKIYRVDPFEIFIKFWPVLLMMCTEFIIITLPVVFDITIPSDLVFLRMGIFFLHFYYFVPFLYYFSRSPKQYHLASEKNHLSTRIRYYFEWFFNSASKVYLFFLWALLTVFVVASAYRYWDHSSQQAPALKAAWEKTQLLSQQTPPGKVVVAQDPLVNLLIPVNGRQGTLWISRFSNQVSEKTILESLALYAHIFDWSEQDYLEFIMPGNIQKLGFNAVVPLNSREIKSAGVGYWLIMGKSLMRDLKMTEEYRDKARKIFQDIVPIEALRRFKVQKIISETPVAQWLPVASKTESKLGTLYLLNN